MDPFDSIHHSDDQSDIINAVADDHANMFNDHDDLFNEHADFFNVMADAFGLVSPADLVASLELCADPMEVSEIIRNHVSNQTRMNYKVFCEVMHDLLEREVLKRRSPSPDNSATDNSASNKKVSNKKASDKLITASVKERESVQLDDKDSNIDIVKAFGIKDISASNLIDVFSDITQKELTQIMTEVGAPLEGNLNNDDYLKIFTAVMNRPKPEMKPEMKRSYIQYTTDEINLIIEGVLAVGRNETRRWQMIKNLYFKESFRTAQNIRDKWRTLVTSSSAEAADPQLRHVHQIHMAEEEAAAP